jgi:hypothetical protein
LSHPDIIPKAGFPEWCRQQQRAGRRLCDLQIEMCKWAIKQIPFLPADAVTAEQKHHSIVQIKHQIAVLQAKHEAVVSKSIRYEAVRETYTKEEADDILAERKAGGQE